MAYFKILYQNFLGESKEIYKVVRRGSGCLGRELNPRLLEYETEVIVTQPHMLYTCNCNYLCGVYYTSNNTATGQHFRNE
jgi:hypothetical protein